MADVLYHYTSESGFEKIIKNPEKFVNDAQKFSKTRSLNEDPDYKVGFYFTDITPQNNTWKQIAMGLFEDDSKASMKQCEYFIVIQHWGNIKQFERNTRFYMLPESTTTKQKFVMGGRTDTYCIPEDEFHRVKIGKPYITVYEKARIIGSRALQLSHGAPPLIDIQENKDLIELAQLELKTRVLPIGIERKLPNGKIQTIPVQWLSDKDFIQQINVSDEIKAFREIVHSKEPLSKKTTVESKKTEKKTTENKKKTSSSKKAKNQLLRLNLKESQLNKLSDIADWKAALALDRSSIKNTGLRQIKKKQVVLSDELLSTQRYCEKRAELDYPEEPSMFFSSTEGSLNDVIKAIDSDKPVIIPTYLSKDNVTIIGNATVQFENKKPIFIILTSVTDEVKGNPSPSVEFKGHFNYFALKEMGFNVKNLKVVFVETTPNSKLQFEQIISYLNGDKSALADSTKVTTQSLTKKREESFQRSLSDFISYWKKDRKLKKQTTKKRCIDCPHVSTCELSLVK